MENISDSFIYWLYVGIIAFENPLKNFMDYWIYNYFEITVILRKKQYNYNSK